MIQQKKFNAQNEFVPQNKFDQRNKFVILAKPESPYLSLLLLLLVFLCSPLRAQQPTGQSIYALTQQFLNVAPKRFNGSPGHLAAENFIKNHFKPEAA